EYASQDAVRALGSGGFTTAPPKPALGPQWKGVTEFATGAGETDALALVIEDGSEPLKVCSVTVDPEATTIPLSKVLDAAVAGGSTPSACVTSYAPTSGTGAITQVNGGTGTPAAGWKIGIDGGALATAERGTTIHVGDTIYLKFEEPWEPRPPADFGGRAVCGRAPSVYAARPRGSVDREVRCGTGAY